jgi:hypothetical protein
MANDRYIIDDNITDEDYSVWQEEFYLWSSCNDVAELIVSKGYNNVMSIITELVASKYKVKQEVFDNL